MSAAAAASSTGIEPIDWAASTSSQGWLGCCFSRAATAAIGITLPLFQSRWESATSRVCAVSACSNEASTAAARLLGSWVLQSSSTGSQWIFRPSRRASSWQAATTPGCSQSLISSSSPALQGRPQSGSTQPLVTFSVRAKRWGPTPHRVARAWRTRAVSCSMNGHTTPVKGPSSWMRCQLLLMACSAGVGRGPCPP